MSGAPVQEEANNPNWITCFLPCSGGWLLIWFLTVFLLLAPDFILADGAVARHITTGLDIIQRGYIAQTNYVWAINPQSPWLTHELLADLTFGGAYRLLGLNGVALVGFLLVGTALAWSYQIARAQGLGRITSWIAFVPVLLANSLHWLSRGHIFSYIFLLIVFYANIVKELPFKTRFIISVISMVLWCNFHGSIFLGLFILALPPALKLINSVWDGTFGERKKAIARDFTIPLAAAAALCINVRGFSEYSYLISYLFHPEILGKGSEWRSIDFSMGISIWAFLALFGIFVLLTRFSKDRLPMSQWILCLTLFVGGIYVMRLIPYFALIVLPALGCCWSEIRKQAIGSPAKSPFQKLFRNFCIIDANKPTDQKQDLKHAAARFVLLLVLAGVFLFVPRFKVKEFPKNKLPVAAIDYMQSQNIHGPGFNFDNWGPYLYYRLKSPVFIDEKTDFYPVEFMNEYIATYNGENTAVLDRYKANYVLVQPESGLAKLLDKSAQWNRIFADKVSVLYLRKKS